MAPKERHTSACSRVTGHVVSSGVGSWDTAAAPPRGVRATVALLPWGGGAGGYCFCLLLNAERRHALTDAGHSCCSYIGGFFSPSSSRDRSGGGPLQQAVQRLQLLALAGEEERDGPLIDGFVVAHISSGNSGSNNLGRISPCTPVTPGHSNGRCKARGVCIAWGLTEEGWRSP